VSGAAFLLHGVTLALVWFLAVNVAVTLLVAAAATHLTTRDTPRAPAFWLRLRLLPVVAAVTFVAAVFAPSYLEYEPREFFENFNAALAAIAAAALLLCVVAACRGLVSWHRARRRVDAWLRIAQPLTLADNRLPGYRVEVDAPMMALVGLRRPRLFVTRGVLDVLTKEELAAAVAHELEHWRAWDNVKRLAMRAAPDLLALLPAGRAIERRWASASEHAADDGASKSIDAANRARERCALASALVKVVRLTPPVTPLAEPISTLVDGGDVASRVRSLLDDRPAGEERRPASWFLLVLGAAAALAYAPLLSFVHEATELLVRTLS
jgi:Zn-dependent protease with chaperone function